MMILSDGEDTEVFGGPEHRGGQAGGPVSMVNFGGLVFGNRTLVVP